MHLKRFSMRRLASVVGLILVAAGFAGCVAQDPDEAMLGDATRIGPDESLTLEESSNGPVASVEAEFVVVGEEGGAIEVTFAIVGPDGAVLERKDAPLAPGNEQELLVAHAFPEAGPEGTYRAVLTADGGAATVTSASLEVEEA